VERVEACTHFAWWALIGVSIGAVLRMSPALSTLLLFAVVIVCAGFLLLAPRAVVWAETPSLRLPAVLVRASLDADAKLAAQAPRTPAAQKVDALWLQLGRADREGMEPTHLRLTRRQDMRKAYQLVVKESGEAAEQALRSAVADRLDRALDLELAPELAADVLGDFALMLEGEECTRNGELIAPRFVVRTLYKARWNIAHQLEPDRGFAPIEKRAYFGWQALHARRLPSEQRMRALVQYARVGGTRANEAAGVLLSRSNQPPAAAAAFALAYRLADTFRLRNAVLGQNMAAAGAGFDE